MTISVLLLKSTGYHGIIVLLDECFKKTIEFVIHYSILHYINHFFPFLMNLHMAMSVKLTSGYAVCSGCRSECEEDWSSCSLPIDIHWCIY